MSEPQLPVPARPGTGVRMPTPSTPSQPQPVQSGSVGTQPQQSPSTSTTPSGEPDAQPTELGAGGTSAARPAQAHDSSTQAAKGKVAAAAAAPAAVVGGQAAGYMMFLNWLKTMFLGAMTAASGFLQSLAGMGLAAAKTVIAGAMSAGGALAGFLGGAISATTGAVAVVTSLTVVAAAVVIGVVDTVNADSVSRREGALPACAPQVQQAVTDAQVSDVVASQVAQANASHIYSVLKGMGMSDENIAGILGNWSVESGIDPTGVETIFDEKYTVGPKKTAAQAVGFAIAKYNPSYAAKYPAIQYAGIGLGQWTNARDQALLAYATAISKPWSDIDTQLGFMVSAQDSGSTVVKAMISTPSAGVDQATSDFLTKWEGIGTATLDMRTKAAQGWFVKMGDWSANVELANSILAQAGTALQGANGNAVSQAADVCRSVQNPSADNTSLAMAALSYAWPTTAEGVGNNGTPLYQELHQYIFPGDPWYMSCDRSVAVAVRWSGTDDSFPPGAVVQQIGYLSTSPKWQEVTWSGDPNNLQPGDILIRYDGTSGVQHIVLYVGTQLPLQVFGGKAPVGASVVSGSFNTRSPGTGVFYTGSEGLDTYRAFRNVTKETSSKYSSYVPKSATNVTVKG